jgi:hypothetical protein
MGSTKKELVDDLRKKPWSLKREYVLKRALKGVYHDFDTELATPKLQLVADLRQAGFEDLADRTIAGEYDDERPSVEQIEEMRRDFGGANFDAIFGKGGRGES